MSFHYVLLYEADVWFNSTALDLGNPIWQIFFEKKKTISKTF